MSVKERKDVTDKEILYEFYTLDSQVSYRYAKSIKT